MNVPSYPFQAAPDQLLNNIETYIDGFIQSLQSFFLVMPKGQEFVDFPIFQQAYQALRNGTNTFQQFSPQVVSAVVQQNALVLVVLRTMLGFSPPEFAHIASVLTGVQIDQSSARRIDKRARDGRPLFARTSAKTQQQVTSLVRAAVQLLEQGAPTVSEGVIHRLDKVDTREGLEGVKKLADGGVSYETLLYERFLGRPFATHRDAVSEKVGDVLESALRQVLEGAQIPYHEAGVAQHFEDMDQAPDFFVPNQFQPSVLIEAKLAEDDGTARDKVTRIQHLAEIRERRIQAGLPAYDVVACVDGRGFGVRRERVGALLIATHGKLFTLQSLDHLIANTALKTYVSHP